MESEEIEEYWGERCVDFDATCPCCSAWKMFDQYEEMKQQRDKAVEVAFEFGADEWVQENYPMHYQLMQHGGLGPGLSVRGGDEYYN